MYRWVIIRGNMPRGTVEAGTANQPLPPIVYEFTAPDLAGALRCAEALAPEVLMEGGRVLSRASYDLTNEELSALRRREDA